MNQHQFTPEFIYVTHKGFQQLQQQLDNKQQEYAQIREHRQVAFELSGDGWHDNPEFNRMQQLEASLNLSVKTLTERLQQARIVEINDNMRPLEQVGIGSVVNIVRFSYSDDEQLNEYWEIVGFDESNIPAKQLAYNAPLAMAIMGLQAGDIVDDFKIGSKEWEIVVIQLLNSRPIANH